MLPFGGSIQDGVDFLIHLAAKKHKRVAYFVVIVLREFFFVENPKDIPVGVVTSITASTRTKKNSLTVRRCNIPHSIANESYFLLFAHLFSIYRIQVQRYTFFGKWRKYFSHVAKKFLMYTFYLWHNKRAMMTLNE